MTVLVAAICSVLLLPVSSPLYVLFPQVTELADVAHGFVAADMAGLCNEAAMIALRRIVKGPPGGDRDPRVTFADFTAARALIRPSAMRELVIEVPRVRALLGLLVQSCQHPAPISCCFYPDCAYAYVQVTWDDIGGLEDVKQQLKEAVELPFKNPEALKRLGVIPPRGAPPTLQARECPS
jgi:hypothetical protein